MSEIKFKPMGDQILIKPDEVETKTKSGLILSETSVDSPKTGLVVKLGSLEGKLGLDNQQFQFDVKVGTRVFWNYRGVELELDGVKYLVMPQGQLLGFEE
jgi:chaperonin GroES